MKVYSPLSNAEPVLAILSQISFLGGVSEAQRAEVFRHLEVGHFEPGEYISRKGEEPSHLYVIAKGRVELRIADGEVEIAKRCFQLGDCFGEAALLSLINHTASFVAAEDCELIMLSRRSLNLLRRNDPTLFTVLIVNLARELARKLQYTDELMLQHEHHAAV